MTRQTPSDETRCFLNALFAGKPSQPYLLIWTLHRKTSRWFQSEVEAASFVSEQEGSDVYVGVALADRKLGPHDRCKSNETAGIPGLWADIDLKSEAHSKSNLPTTIDEALTILPGEFPPSVLVETGNGLHAWWLFREPWMFADDEERVRASKLVMRWQTLLKHTAQSNGWHLDRLADLARVLRVPGTTNRKDSNNPKPVILRELNGHRYAPGDFKACLDALRIEDTNEIRRLAQARISADRSSVLTIDPSASIDEKRLQCWLKEDDRFQSTWSKDRSDLTDQSNSAYDLALACFGVKRGLADQEIVALIFHHRRVHACAIRKTEDYFRRTISKARRREQPEVEGSQQTAEEGERARSGHLLAKAKHWEQLSAILKVDIVRMRKVQGSDPTFLIDLTTCCIALESIDILMSYKAVAAKIAAQAGYIVPRFGPAKWREVAQMMLDACIPVSVSKDLDLGGAVQLHIEQYLDSRTLHSSLEDLERGDKTDPVIYGNRILISLQELRRFIVATSSQNIGPQKIATMLTVLGAESVRLRCKRIDQDRWALPAIQFDPATYLSRGPE